VDELVCNVLVMEEWQWVFYVYKPIAPMLPHRCRSEDVKEAGPSEARNLILCSIAGAYNVMESMLSDRRRAPLRPTLALGYG
jgi:hypothetical protein